MHEVQLILILLGGVVGASLWFDLLYLIRSLSPGESRKRDYRTPQFESTAYFVYGQCWVIDADDISVNSERIRLSGIDAPESDQTAVGWDGTTYDQGEVVKRMLCKKIGGKRVEVRIDGTDRYGRKIGTVFLNGEDINRRMVRKGLAIAAYGNQYKEDESIARKLRKGMWRDKIAYDPRYWKYGKRVPI